MMSSEKGRETYPSQHGTRYADDRRDGKVAIDDVLRCGLAATTFTMDWRQEVLG